MAFTVGTNTNLTWSPGKRRVTGTFSGGAPTAGEITVGQLSNIKYASVTGASDISVSGNVITVTSAATAGFWEAEGI
ncbi:MAG: hypothetical protein JEZ12_21580 [Desulfobacterium sp.]|nr:hypothetical protein [Desulfobacterium sp.]